MGINSCVKNLIKELVVERMHYFGCSSFFLPIFHFDVVVDSHQFTGCMGISPVSLGWLLEYMVGISCLLNLMKLCINWGQKLTFHWIDNEIYLRRLQMQWVLMSLHHIILTQAIGSQLPCFCISYWLRWSLHYSNKRMI